MGATGIFLALPGGALDAMNDTRSLRSVEKRPPTSCKKCLICQAKVISSKRDRRLDRCQSSFAVGLSGTIVESEALDDHLVCRQHV